MTAPDPRPAGTTGGTPQVLLAHHLKQLRLPTVLREYDKVARECARDGVDPPRYLLRLIELEQLDRERRTVERRIRAARFPATKSFDTFDFAAIPRVEQDAGAGADAPRVHPAVGEHHRAGQQRHRQNACGVGAGPCSLPEGVLCCVHYGSLAGQPADGGTRRAAPAQAAARPTGGEAADRDELGYVPLSPTGAELLFEAFSQRYERGSTIVTSNLPFEDWTSVLGSERLTGALLDRLTHHVSILTMNGDSYRLRQSASRHPANSITAEQNQSTDESIDPETGDIITG